MSVRLINVCGARPNFMKIAPLMKAYSLHSQIDPILLHTGQHYDEKMSELFFKQLGIPEPDINLGVGSASHAVQTATIMQRFEAVLTEHPADAVLVVGDVNSTIACALVAAKLQIKVIHVEAGLRSFDRTMPEEINRLLTDAISDLLFVSEPSGVENLRREGVDEQKIHFVGNVMIDTLMHHRERADQSDILQRLSITPKQYALVTLHRPANVDDREKFTSIIQGLGCVSDDVTIIFAMHPRTRKNVETLGLASLIERFDNIHVTEPFGYLDFLKLMSDAACVLTDSGGMQEETTILAVPCLTLRENTERPITITNGTNQLVEPAADQIVAAWQRVKNDPTAADRIPPMWDGQAAQRIAGIIAEHLSQ